MILKTKKELEENGWKDVTEFDQPVILVNNFILLAKVFKYDTWDALAVDFPREARMLVMKVEESKLIMPKIIIRAFVPK